VSADWKERLDEPSERTRASRGGRALAHCPHCQSPGIIRTSAPVTILVRDIYFLCTNPECGHSWKAQLSFLHTISQPATPRAGLDLPVSPIRRSQPPQADNDSRALRPGHDPPQAA
jgi:hypothetical protein